MTRYHLWLMPSGARYDLLADTIAELSRLYQAPYFDPHVTLLGTLTGSEPEIVTNAARLAHELDPFEIRLGPPSYTEHYFQCLFLQVEETRPLMEAHAKTAVVFDREPNYRPHLSLLYGRYSPALKERIIAGLSSELREPFLATCLNVIKAASDNPEDWQRIRSLAFRTAAEQDLPI
jgi:hypothetical protein